MGLILLSWFVLQAFLLLLVLVLVLEAPASGLPGLTTAKQRDCVKNEDENEDEDDSVSQFP